MKQYVLSVCYPAGATQPAPAELARIMRGVGDVHQEMKAQDAWLFGGGLTDASSATVVRSEADGFVMTDGPFIESKEQIGGFSIVRAADLDAALAWAKKLTRAIGVPIEVRAMQDGRG